MSGPFGSSQWMYNAGGSFYNYSIDGSLRFNDNDSSYLEKTFSTSGNAKTFTISFWFKRGNINNAQYFFAGGTTVNDRFHMDINASGTWQIEAKNSGTTVIKMEGGPVLRDPSSWYHFVLRVDTTQATASDRVRLYKNGELVTFNSNTYPPQNENLNWNVNDQVRIGRAGWATSYFDGYMAEFINVDGQSLAPTEFGETKSGIWIPKDYSGSFGTNGFHLEFAGNTNDSSGNSNNFTANNISSYDYVPDSPTNNFSTLNSINNAQGATLSQGNLRAANVAANDRRYHSTFGMTTGKWYWEVRINTVGNRNLIGIWSDEDPASTTVTDNYARLGVGNGSQSTSGTYNSGAVTASAGNILSFAFDADAGELYTKINGTPDTGSTASFTNLASDTYLAGVRESGGTAGNNTYNFGQDSSFAGATTAQGNTDDNGLGDFYYAPPSGFLALCSNNLPAPTFDPLDDDTPEDYFNTVLYTGDGTANRTISAGLTPDFVWMKDRSAAYSHIVIDSVRGNGNYLATNSSNQENWAGNLFPNSGPTTNGFVVDGNLNVSINANGDSYVAWNWKAGGTAVSNTDGSITSSVSANPDAGFSVVTWTGTAGSDTIGHGLGTAPNMIITKPRSADNWIVYHQALGATKQVYLDLTNGQETNANIYSVVPTSSVFTIGSWSSTRNLVSYCFAEKEGYSKVGSYIGNGSTDGSFVYTGFQPAFWLVKAIVSNESWKIIDNRRHGGYNLNDAQLTPSSSSAETNDGNGVDFVSNGIKLRSSIGNWNTSGTTYIYMAFAEQPFKYANAR